MDSNTSIGKKRPTKCDLDEPSTSKQPQIACTSITIGAVIHAEGNARVTINNLNVGDDQPPHDIEFQVADPVDTFRGREHTFLDVKRAFDQQKDKHQYNLVAVCGYGGMGKTQFVRMYIKRNRREYQNLVWIFAESETTLRDSFGKLQNLLKDRGYPCYGEQDVYKHLNCASTVFVFDNAENIRSVQEFLPARQNNSLFLVTSKSKDWDTFNTIELKLLDLIDAKDIMRAVLVEKHKIKISDKQLKEIVKKFELEAIPLLLQIRAGYICRQVRSLTNRGKQYNIEDIIKQLNIQHDLVSKKFHNFILDPYNKSVYAAIYQTLEQIWNTEEEESIIAAKIIEISAYLNPEEILEDVFKELLQIEDEFILNESLDILFQFSLFQISNFGIGIHRTIQQCILYHHSDIIKTSEYYRLTLPVLIKSTYIYEIHHQTIFHHGEKDFESLCTFYERNKCNQFHRNLVKFAPFKIIKLVLIKYELARNPYFLSKAVGGSRDIIQILHECNTDFNVKDDQGCNAFFYVYLPKDNNDNIFSFSIYYASKWKTAKALTANGADVNSQNSEGNTVIHSLCNLGKNSELDHRIFEICALIIHLGANPEIENKSKQTPIDLARDHGLTQTLQLLQKAICGYKYISHLAAKYKQFDCLKRLIEHEICYKNDQDNNGSTVLHILAGIELDHVDKENIQLLLNETAFLLKSGDWNVNIKNVAGETASDLARKYNREKLADLLEAWIEPGGIIFTTAAYREKLKHFLFMENKNSKHVNEQDKSGGTLLHALCDLEENNTDVELEIVKYVAHLVIHYFSYVNITNMVNEIPADVARRNGMHLLADLLDLVNEGGLEKDLLVCVALKHKQFHLAKYAWWRYMYISLSGDFLAYYMLHSIESILYALEGDPTEIDDVLINFIDYLNVKEMTENCKDKYLSIVETAKQHGREKLAVWMQK